MKLLWATTLVVAHRYLIFAPNISILLFCLSETGSLYLKYEFASSNEQVEAQEDGQYEPILAKELIQIAKAYLAIDFSSFSKISSKNFMESFFRPLIL